jgi:hypothetical protein
MVISAENGVHDTRVVYCRCGSPPQEKLHQLLNDAGVFPSSPSAPRFAFRVGVLEKYLDEWKPQGGRSATGFVRWLRGKTDDEFSERNGRGETIHAPVRHPPRLQRVLYSQF